MTSIRHCRQCFQSMGTVSLRDARYSQRPLLSKFPDARCYSNGRSTGPAPKPLPFKPKQEPKPLVQAKPTTQAKSQGSPLNQIGNSSSRPNAQQDRRGVYAPYLRLSLGVVLIGSIIYSMVCTPVPPFSPPS